MHVCVCVLSCCFVILLVEASGFLWVWHSGCESLAGVENHLQGDIGLRRLKVRAWGYDRGLNNWNRVLGPIIVQK